ncbi:transporter substrate-binding domain-containing protein [Streptomyces sp. TLI_171]|uniref:transporter substrate-binding domain-containing protein n=1 Tax=Streptomyces sp. TLI_171 TaxID=1938859 RepID=UPI0015D53B0C|nr:transporter substrate-binding domain-containing protein [Streptomyces sp. TLI_171]
MDLRVPPLESRDAAGTAQGMEVELAAELSRRLGVKLTLVDIPFSDLLDSLTTNKVDLVLSGMTDTRARRLGRDKPGGAIRGPVDFVDYFQAGTGIVVAADNPHEVHEAADLCGLRIVVRQGTIHEDFAHRTADNCRTAHRPEPTIRTVASEEDSMKEIADGRTDATVSDYPVAVHLAATFRGGKAVRTAVANLRPEPYGMAVRAADKDLSAALYQAVDEVIDGGVYMTLLDHWGLQDGAMVNADINSGS